MSDLLVTSSSISISPATELGDLSFDYALIASQISKSRKDRGKPTPDSITLNSAITAVKLDDAVDGSSTLVVDLADPSFTLVDFFDIDENGHVDAIDMNYPLDSPNWWRMTQFGLDNAAGLFRIKLTFMERPAVYLLHRHGPRHASRASVTRAEFLKRLVSSIKADTLVFRSKELHKRQPISQDPSDQGEVGTLMSDPGPSLRQPIDQGPFKPKPTPPKPVTPKERKDGKQAGIAYGTGLKIGAPPTVATNDQIDQMNRALDTAYSFQEVDQRMVEALCCAGIGESQFRPIMNTKGSGFGGVFQGDVDNGTNGRVWAGKINDTEGMATCFLFGGKGFQPAKNLRTGQEGRGGAYYWHKENPGWGPGLIAVSVEGSRQNFPSDEAAEHYYGQYASQAREMIKLYGGGFEGGGTTYRQQFNFQVGTDADPFETYWDAMNRLASEVKWRVFIDGRTIYFDSDMTLIRQQPALVLELGNPRILRWNANWDERNIATEMSIDLLCNPFEFRAGEVFLLQGFGPLSTGSTAKLPGRWLVTKISRDSGSPYSTFTLGQPVTPLREPATKLGELKEDDPSIAGKGLEGIHDNMTAKEVIDTLVLPLARAHDMVTGRTPDMVVSQNDAHDRFVSGTTRVSWHKGPPAAQWAADMSNGGSPTKEMDALAEELRQKFKMGRWADKDAATPNPGNLLSKYGIKAGGRKYDFQLIYRAPDHMDHVHFGVRLVGPVQRDDVPHPG